MKENRNLLEQSINEQLNGVTLEELRERRGGSIRFPVYTSGELMAADISDLDLTVRAFNCLKRASISTVGELVERIDGKEDLLKIRNMGTKSANEVMQHLFFYQYSLLQPERRKKFLERVMELNR